ncbi:nickel pincer cofactor biosynthesis protein LarB [Methanosphaera cuniculi]|uniref:nickel pincer cofactor biosynthesis protein LarB n=1 Tax=Methanosphaera cuniculi TaxID=1077256 RepID=UPI0026EC2B43|nr:nickel pincer cofactor biosynthesis protein LarB [Methanosphaera cuniculi]
MKEILEKLVNGSISIIDAEDKLKIMQMQEIGEHVKFDDRRSERTGVPEAIYAQGKTDDDLINLINNIKIPHNLMITRLPQDRYKKIQPQLNDSILENATYYKDASILTINKFPIEQHKGRVGIITAGTADIPIAEEANITIKQEGIETITTYDVGVAGIHRLVDKLSHLLDQQIDIIIVVAGMEGALPSVIGGLVDVPIVAVPTSTGYGVGEKGFTALFSMLQSCAPGISTMNIDNGYGAGVYAIKMIKHLEKRIKQELEKQK